MPVSAYFKGKGEKVMADMKKRYPGRGEEVFYRTASARGMKPGAKGAKKHKAFAE